MAISVQVQDAVTQVSALIAKNDAKLDALWDKVDETSEVLEDDTQNNQQKWQSSVTLQYYLLRLRALVSAEHVKVTRLSTAPEIPVSVKALFTKRATYLSQVQVRIDSFVAQFEALSRAHYFNK